MIERGARALRHRNFRLFLLGQAVSVVGTWMQTVAVGWLVYRLTSSPLLLGVSAFVSQAPSLLAPIAGAWIDRVDRRRLVVATQVLSFLQALALAALVLAGSATIEAVLGLGLALGLVNAVDVPARQSFLVHMVDDRADLASAIALNSAVFNGARLVGPAIAGVLVAAIGEGPVFLVNAATYLPVLAALLSLRLPGQGASRRPGPPASRFSEGVVYVHRSLPIRTILLYVAGVSLAAAPSSTLMPMFARDLLHGGPRTLGLLVGAMGAGALCGSLYVATRESAAGLTRVVAACGALLGAALAAFALARSAGLACAALALAGFANTALLASSNTMLQAQVDEGKRGRVMSFYTMALVGMTPVGALLTGLVAGGLGPRAVVVASGAGCALAAAAFHRAMRGRAGCGT